MHCVRRQKPAARVSDATIMARVAEGDVEALGLLYDRYAPGLLAYARHVDRNDAEDVIQTVFLRVMRIAPSFQPTANSARPWLFAITTRVLQERTRALRRFGAAMLRLAADVGERTDAVPEARADIYHYLTRLTLAKRTVVVLAEFEGFQCQEIADMLSVPIGTVWTRLHHARKELQRYYHEEGA